MFSVRFTDDAKAMIATQFERGAFTLPGVTIHRQGPRADVKRTSDGEAQWAIERPHPWRAQIGDFQTFGENAEDVFLFDDIRVWLALIPRPEEAGVVVSVRDGDLFVEPIRV